MKSFLTYSYFFLMALMLLIGCGDPAVSIDKTYYTPKIAVEGFLMPGMPVANIFVWRNFPTGADITDPRLPAAIVTITDLQNDQTYTLRYRAENGSFFYPAMDLRIDHEKSYRLDVSAKVDGKELTASSTTTVPKAGLGNVVVNFDSLKYRERDGQDEIKLFKLEFDRSPGTDFYAFTMRAMNATPDNFIYDNAFSSDIERQDVIDDLNEFAFRYGWLQNTPLTAGRSDQELYWFDLWFYDDYEIVVFAADQNYRDYIRTYNDVQEIDGNYHEPKFYFEGDGIGVFGSAVTDTIYVKVVK